MSEDLIIARATPDDRTELASLFRDMLAALAPHGHDMLPTFGNATTMVDEVLLPAAGHGDPVLLAWHRGIAVGALFWAQNRQPFEFRAKHYIGYGTYVAEKYRRHGISARLRARGVEIARAHGITQVIGGTLIDNHAGREATRAFGFKPVAFVERLDILPIQTHTHPACPTPASVGDFT